MKKIMLFILVSWILTGCGASEDSSDVNQARIYTDYELFYNANEDKTHAIARFRFGGPFGTILELSRASGASVSFNGELLAYSSLWGGHHKEYAGNVTSGSFNYVDTDGTSYTNAVPVGASIEFPAGFNQIDISSAQTLSWVGSALAANDQVGIFVGSWVWGDDALFLTDADGATSIVMGLNQLQNLALGSAVVFMDRWNAVNVSEGTAEGGRIRYKYRATNAIVTVVDGAAP